MLQRLTFALLLVAACGSDGDSAGSADANPDCTMDPRAQTYLPGMSVAADDGVQVSLLEALPAPPVRFDNVWTLQILDAADQPLADTQLVVEPYMPDHGHGTPQPPSPVQGEGVGVYDMGPFDLWMPGIWELRFSVAHAGTTSLVVMTFCLEE